MTSAKSGTSVPVPDEIQITTTDKITLNWVIKGFGKLYQSKSSNAELAHRKFTSTAGNDDDYFRAETKGRFCIEKGEDYIGLYLQLSNNSASLGSQKPKTKTQASYSVSMESNNGELISIYDVEQCDLSQYKVGYGSDKMMEIDELRQNFLKEGVLRARLIVKLYCGTEEALKISANESRKRNEMELINKDLAQIFGNFLLSGDFADVEFAFPKKEQDKETEVTVKAHKLVLSVRSPVFATMFNTEMKEGLTGKVVIDDICAESFKMLLQFMYTGKLNGDWGSMVDELIYAANKYEITSLEGFLNKNIMEVINVDNAIKARKMAKLCNLQQAQQDIEVFTKDHWEEILDMMET